jgi:hypothetical protein
MLDDLSRYTKVDTIELLDFVSQVEKPGAPAPRKYAVRVLPTSKGLNLDLPLYEKEEFEAASKFLKMARSKGFKVACNFVPLWLGTEQMAPSSLVDVNGRRVKGPGDTPTYGCPNDPKMKKYAEFMVRNLVKSWPAMDLLEINHMEYPHILLWVYPKVDVDSMFVCFCKSCEKAAKAKGLDFDKMREDAKALLTSISKPAGGVKGSKKRKSAGGLATNSDDVVNLFLKRPYLATWLRFRMDSMTEFSRGLVVAAREEAKEHNPKLKIGLQFQLPALSPLLGTDFVSLSADLDFIVPKFFDYIPASVLPLFAQEVAARTGLDKKVLLRKLREAFDLGPGPEKYEKTPMYPKISHGELYSNSFDYSVVSRQMKYLEPLVGKVAIQPGILEPNRGKPGLMKKIKALSKEGFEDFWLWSWEEGLTTEHLKSLQGIL